MTAPLWWTRRSAARWWSEKSPLAKARWVVETWVADLLTEIDHLAKDLIRYWRYGA